MKRLKFILRVRLVHHPKKRDLGLKFAKGEILAFIDDDAYPEKDWLKNAIKNFIDSDIAAVGGPAITPEEDNLRQRASGKIYESFLVSGRFNLRYIPKNKCYVDDFPTCNFFVRKSVMDELGGFKISFWPGEDTFLCLEVTKKLGKKIVYDPEVKVYHHRRPLFLPHLRQITRYALHRGHFVKRYPQTSLRLPYFIPSFLLVGLILGLVLSLISPFLRIIYLILLITYLLLVFLFSLSKNIELAFLKFSGIILTHLVYGLFFIKGLISKQLREEFRK